MYEAARSQKEQTQKEKLLKEKMVERSERIAKRKGGQILAAELLRDPEDIRVDARYGGQTEILIKYVPMKCIDEYTAVDIPSIREWVIYAIVEEDPASQKYFDEIQRLNELIEDIDRNIKKIPRIQFFDENGSPKSEEECRLERDKLFLQYGEDLVRAESRLDDVNLDLKNHVEWRKKMGVKLTLLETNPSTQTADYLLELYGTDDAQEIEDILMQKRNWQGIKLAVGFKKRDEPYVPPWAGRGDVPDGKNPTLPNYSGYSVNMLGVRIMRVPTGIGLYRHLDRNSTSLAHEQFGVYYGEYEHGLKNGYGIEINDAGVYTGSFEKGFRRGHGRLDLADGTTIVGHFDFKPQSTLPSIPQYQNPYLDGEPFGQVEIYFSDGAYYRGHMLNSEITGQGDYQSAFNEMMSGNFVNGVLDGKNGFHQNAADEVYMGNFHNGELHGFGTYLNNKTGDSYDGYFEHYLRHGRGVSKYTNAGVHRGYYINGIKHGKGSIEFGKKLKRGKTKSKPQEKKDDSKSDQKTTKKGEKKKDGLDSHENVIDQLKDFDNKMKKLTDKSGNKASSNSNQTKEETAQEAERKAQEERDKAKEAEADEVYEFSPYENIYQGYFLGNNVTNLGSVMNTYYQQPSILSRLDRRKVYPINRVIAREDFVSKRIDKILEKYSDLEHFIRTEIMLKKLKIFRQQKHFSKETIYNEDVYNKFDHRQIEQKLKLRQERMTKLKKIAEQGEESDKNFTKKALIPRLKLVNSQLFQNYTQGLERMKPDPKTLRTDDYINNELLKAVFSDFEEVRERQRLLKYDLIWQRAEEAYESTLKAAHA